MGNFKERWNITSNWQVFVILIVFAVTGSTSALAAKPLLVFIGITKATTSGWLYFPLYIILVFPIYQLLLVSFGFIFGQFKFFWAFEKKMLRSMKLHFIADFFENKKRN
jgi:hypothetical protein